MKRLSWHEKEAQQSWEDGFKCHTCWRWTICSTNDNTPKGDSWLCSYWVYLSCPYAFNGFAQLIRVHHHCPCACMCLPKSQPLCHNELICHQIFLRRRNWLCCKYSWPRPLVWAVPGILTEKVKKFAEWSKMSLCVGTDVVSVRCVLSFE